MDKPSNKIWNKFTKEEQKLWKELNGLFLWHLQEMKKDGVKNFEEVAAHNLAIEAICIYQKKLKLSNLRFS